MLGREPRIGPAEGTVGHVPEVPLGPGLDQLAAPPARAGKRPRVDHPQGRPRAVISVEQRRHGLGPSPHGSPTSARGPGRHPPNASASCRTAAANASRITTPTRPNASSHPVNCSDGGAVHSNTPGAVTIEQPSVERAFVRSATPGFRRAAAEIGSNTRARGDRASDLRLWAVGGRAAAIRGEIRGGRRARGVRLNGPPFRPSRRAVTTKQRHARAPAGRAAPRARRGSRRGRRRGRFPAPDPLRSANAARARRRPDRCAGSARPPTTAP